MQYSQQFKRLHFLNTLLFIFCTGAIVAQSLRQAGFEWWVIFSISGLSSVTVIFLLCVYIFAIFRGFNRHEDPEIEHPVTSLKIYKVLYCFTPVLGFLTGFLCQAEEYETILSKASFINGSMGTFIITLLIWVTLDPAVTIMESYLPASKKSRDARIEKARIEREKLLAKRMAMLEELSVKEKAERQEQKLILDEPAEQLSDLILSGLRGSAGSRHPEVISLGVKAWQMGGIKSMKLLRDLAWEKCHKKGIKAGIIDEVDYWWDGIGDWRATNL